MFQCLSYLSNNYLSIYLVLPVQPARKKVVSCVFWAAFLVNNLLSDRVVSWVFQRFLSYLNNLRVKDLCLMYFSISCPTSTTCKWQGGSVGRALDLRSKDRRSEPRQRQQHKKQFWEFFRVKKIVLTHYRCAQPLCVHAHIRIVTYAR